MFTAYFTKQAFGSKNQICWPGQIKILIEEFYNRLRYLCEEDLQLRLTEDTIHSEKAPLHVQLGLLTCKTHLYTKKA